MAAGLPTVASPVGANAAIVADGVTGFSPATADGWPAAIARLAGDVGLRARTGAAARQTVEREYTLARAKAVWQRLLAE